MLFWSETFQTANTFNASQIIVLMDVSFLLFWNSQKLFAVTIYIVLLYSRNCTNLEKGAYWLFYIWHFRVGVLNYDKMYCFC